MTIIKEPLNIGASDLLKGVEYTHCGEIHVQYHSVFGRKWKQRYVIISQGCIYIYANRNAKRTEQSYSLKQFESAVECDPESGENICFCLRYKNAQAPILFSCDTLERREKWITKLCSNISEVQSNLYNVSADSGFGSAEAVPRSKLKVHQGKVDPVGYDVVDERNFETPVQPCADDRNYDFPKVFSGATSTQDRFYENMKTKHTDTFQPDEPAKQKVQKVQRDVKSKAFTDELKVKVARKSISTTKEGPLPTTKPTCSQPSGPGSESSFVSIRGATEESMSLLSVREQESLYENDTDSSNDSDNTSPKTIYENPEEWESMKRFERYEYFCDRKIKVKRLLKAIGDFAIFPGESTEHELCVMTPKGLKYFRIYSQNERVSLYRSHQYNTFPSLDDLLSYYSANDLPGADYSVKLQRGYNSMS